MRELLEQIKEKALSELAKLEDLKALKDFRVKFLGKKGEVTQLLKRMRELSPEERPVFGKLVNELKELLEGRIREKEKELKELEKEKKFQRERIDITLPGRKPFGGIKHPIVQVMEEIVDVFNSMGFQIAEGPEIEEDYYNFEALNIPPDHPARDMQDTFYITEKVLLRTHTSPVQIRVMKKYPLPIRIIAPGRVYRRDFDVSHTPMFHQVEGLFG